ncbi:hypothetical protein Barb7_03052 [Bacteroidales bacterium Barb7]|nr:hypothetical protein Barb7_03052 [Bacteroidales bacterium Barb7]
MIHKNTSQVLPDSLVEKHGCHGGIDPAGKGEYYLVISQLFLQPVRRRLNKRSWCPVLCRTANGKKIIKQAGSIRRMKHFRMKLHAPSRLAFHAIGGSLYVRRAGNRLKSVRQRGNRVTVRHPYLRTGLKAFQQSVSPVNAGQIGASVFA